MSTISSNINSTATLFTSDIYQRVLRKRASSRQVIIVARIMTLLVGFFMVGFSFFAKKLGAVNAYLTLIGITDMPLFIVGIVYGIFWKKANWLGAIAGYLSGAITGALSVFVIFAHSPNASTYATFLSASAALIFTPIFSLLLGKNTHQQRIKTIAAALKPSSKEIETGQAFYLIPRSSGGRILLGIFVLGLISFLVSISLGGLGLSKIAAWLSIGSMVVYFGSGLLRLFFD
jgi:SSS family solute:Na+ symporter